MLYWRLETSIWDWGLKSIEKSSNFLIDFYVIWLNSCKQRSCPLVAIRYNIRHLPGSQGLPHLCKDVKKRLDSWAWFSKSYKRIKWSSKVTLAHPFPFYRLTRFSCRLLEDVRGTLHRWFMPVLRCKTGHVWTFWLISEELIDRN